MCIHTVCVYTVSISCRYSICIVICVHCAQITGRNVSACIYLSLWGWGRRHGTVFLCWQEVVFSEWGSAGSDGISYGSRSRWLRGADTQLRCRAVPGHVLTPMVLLWLTWSEAQKVVTVNYYAVWPGEGCRSYMNWPEAFGHPNFTPT